MSFPRRRESVITYRYIIIKKHKVKFRIYLSYYTIVISNEVNNKAAIYLFFANNKESSIKIQSDEKEIEMAIEIVNKIFSEKLKRTVKEYLA